MLEVRKERTGWRDERISFRHRQWGWDCPGVDLDWLFLEYDQGKAVAIVEYKHEKAGSLSLAHPTYQAMIDLSNRAGIPCFVVRYADDFSWWLATAMNAKGMRWIPRPQRMTEREWVTFLYHIRGRELPQEVIRTISVLI